MALIKRPKPKDSIQKFERTAEGKYQSGLRLLDEDDDHTGVEQCGLAAEMFLKSAYFRVVKSSLRLRTNSALTKENLNYARAEGVWLAIGYDPESFHSLLFWALLIVRTRQDQGRGLEAGLETVLRQKMREMYRIWMIEHRYQPIAYHSQDVLLMRANVTWLRENHALLWK